MKLLPVSATLGYQGQQQSQNTVESAVARARSTAKEAGITDLKSLTDEFVKSEAFQKSTKVGDAWRRGVNAAHQESESHTEEARKSRTSAREYREQAEEVRRLVASGDVSWVPEYTGFLERYAVGNELAPAQYRVNDVNAVTGEKALYWQSQFFAQAQIGRVLNGGLALLMPDGSAPPNRQPLQPNMHSGGSLDSLYAGQAVTLDGKTPVTGASIRARHAANVASVPKEQGGDPTKMGQKTVERVEQAPTVVKSAKSGAEMKRQAAETEAQYQYDKKVGEISTATELFGDSDAVKEVRAAKDVPLGGPKK